jgi:hypothetical protein
MFRLDIPTGGFLNENISTHTRKGVSFMRHLKIAFSGLAIAAIFGLYTSGCKKEDNPANTPPPTVEHPPATTVTLILKDSTGATIVDSCTVRDTSQVHGKPTVTGQLDLQAGKTYKGVFVLYDETKTPADNITGDIISEKDAHVFKFRFISTDSTRIAVSGLDVDSKGLPFGLNFTIKATAGGAITGNLHVILEHHDDGNKSGTEFDLDLDRDFPVSIAP